MPGDSGPPRSEFDALVRRLEIIDERGTRNAGAIEARLTDLREDLARLREEITSERQHVTSSRRWIITAVIAAAGAAAGCVATVITVIGH